MSNINPQHGPRKPIEIINVGASENAMANDIAAPEAYVEPQVASSDCINKSVNGEFLTTGIGNELVQASCRKIIDMIKDTTISFDICNGIHINHKYKMFNDGERYPVICLINGVGGIGKDTFVESVGKVLSAYNISSIDPVKEAANYLIDCMADIDHYENTTAAKHRHDKDNQYRTFLHDIKMAWVKFCDGPVNSIMNDITDVITIQLNGGECYDVIFVHIREPEELEKMKNRVINDMGLVCLSILVKGWISPDTFENEGDRSVENFDYDFVITNQYNEKQIFDLQASYFASLLETANKHYGLTPVYEANCIDPVPDNTSKLTVASNNVPIVQTKHESSNFWSNVNAHVAGNSATIKPHRMTGDSAEFV